MGSWLTDWLRKWWERLHPTPPPPPPPPPPLSDDAAELIRLANVERAKAGLRPCSIGPGVQAACGKHGALMASTNDLSHQCPGEPELEVRLTAAGVR